MNVIVPGGGPTSADEYVALLTSKIDVTRSGRNSLQDEYA